MKSDDDDKVVRERERERVVADLKDTFYVS